MLAVEANNATWELLGRDELTPRRATSCSAGPTRPPTTGGGPPAGDPSTLLVRRG